MENTVICHRCTQEITNEKSCNYSVDLEGHTYCLSCSDEREKEYMRTNGKTLLYLSWNEYPQETSVGSFSGGLRIVCPVKWKSGHNWGLTRYNVRFKFDGDIWYGYSLGENTEICHCRRTKLQSVFT